MSTWSVNAGGQTVEVYYDTDATYEQVRNDLINVCGYPEDVKIKLVSRE